jgi:hypothetical protein
LVLTNKGTNAVFSTFGDSSAITIPTGSTASQYPSTINVAGLGGGIIKVTVTLSRHTACQPLSQNEFSYRTIEL